MGQAKQRGTFEQRRAIAIERETEPAKARAEIRRRRPSPKHGSLMQTAVLGLLAGSLLALVAGEKK